MQDFPNDLGFRFDIWLNNEIEESEVTIEDLGLILISVFARARAFLTLDELGMYVAGLAGHMEEAIQAGRGMLNPDTGEPEVILLAEERRQLGTNEVTVPATVPQEWVDELA